jgi:MEKHLA domain
MNTAYFLKNYQNPDFLKKQTSLLVRSYHFLTGQYLIEGLDADVNQLMNFPLAVASHQMLADPVFNYANKEALNLFKMTPSQIMGLPSRYSAEPMLREKREALLEEVRRNGFVENYEGVRIAHDGSRFKIHQATVWNVVDVDSPSKEILGQAVVIKRYSWL